MPLQSPVYTIPYFVVFAIFMWLIISKCPYSTSRIISGIVYVLFLGTRNLIGWDWQAYYPFFTHMPILSDLEPSSFLIFDGTSPVEPGFILYVSAIKTIFRSWELFIFVSTVIDWILIDCFIRRYSTHYVFSLLIFYCLCISIQVDLLRNIKALGIFLISIRFINERRLIPYVFLMLVATLLHYSSLIFFLFYPIGNWIMPRKLFIIIFIIANVLYLTHLPMMSIIAKHIGSLTEGVIGDKLNNYSESTYVRGITVGYIFKFINTLIIIWKYNDIIRLNRNLSLMLILYLIMIFVTFGMNDISVVSERIEDLLMPTYCILFPAALSLIRIIRNRNVCMTYFFIFLMLKLYAETKIVMYNYSSFVLSPASYENKAKEYGSYADKILSNK